MKILKYFFIGLAVLVLLLFIGSFILPGKMHTEVSKEITAEKDYVHALLNNPHYMEKWSPWYGLDTAATYEFFGPESGVGSGYSWKGNKKVGKGKYTILKSEPDVIETELDFGPMGKAIGTFKMEQAGENTKVIWMMDSNTEGMNFMMKRMAPYFSIMMKGAIKKDFTLGLENIELRIDSMIMDGLFAIMSSKIEISLVDVDAQHVLSIREITTYEEIGEKFETLYAEIGEVAGGYEMLAGPPFAFFHSYDDVGCDFEPAWAVIEATEGNERVRGWEWAAHKAVMTRYFGAYEDTEPTYDALQRYAEENGLTISGSPYEIYITDPTTEPDTSKWETDIYFPVTEPAM